MEFDWDDDKAAENKTQHGVSFDEAKEVFFDVGAIEIYDEAHSLYEARYRIIGLSSRGLLTVVYRPKTDDEGKEVIRIVSAWDSTSVEEREYERNR